MTFLTGAKRAIPIVPMGVPMGVLMGVVLALACLAVRPAAAQITLGSPGEPPRIALELGAFDIVPGNHPDSHVAADFGAEYRFGDVLYAFSPFVGALGTSDGAGYAYFGFGFDVNFGPNWVLTPNGAAGVFERGQGIKLGSWWEFRTGAELDYKLPDQSRLGVALHHMSNAGLGKSNPGEESLVLVYTIPFH